jgi:hypothetical protein
MGATNKSALRVTFDSRLKLEFHGSKVTSDAGLLVYWAKNDDIRKVKWSQCAVVLICSELVHMQYT